jgi:hypothetical protein
MATSQEIYRDLSDNGKLDGRYTSVELKRALDVPPADRPDVAPQRVAAPVPATGLEASTPATSMPVFWIALFLVALLVWWCVDRYLIAGRRR